MEVDLDSYGERKVNVETKGGDLYWMNVVVRLHFLCVSVNGEERGKKFDGRLLFTGNAS